MDDEDHKLHKYWLQWIQLQSCALEHHHHQIWGRTWSHHCRGNQKGNKKCQKLLFEKPHRSVVSLPERKVIGNGKQFFDGSLQNEWTIETQNNFGKVHQPGNDQGTVLRENGAILNLQLGGNRFHLRTVPGQRFQVLQSLYELMSFSFARVQCQWNWPRSFFHLPWAVENILLWIFGQILRNFNQIWSEWRRSKLPSYLWLLDTNIATNARRRYDFGQHANCNNRFADRLLGELPSQSWSTQMSRGSGQKNNLLAFRHGAPFPGWRKHWDNLQFVERCE